jgi:zinc and cadmium transporter
MVGLNDVIFFSLLGGLVSLTGAIALLRSRHGAKLLADYATPFAAGALLAAAFLDLLPEGLELSGPNVLTWTLVGIVVFFLLESVLNWFHHHHEHDNNVDPTVSLIVTGDTIHNFIDGAAIAAAFLISLPTGIVTTIAVAAHEIPQEIGDFGLMLNKGLRRRQALLVNLLSSVATTVGAVLFFSLGSGNDALLTVLLGLTAGFFIYIAASDIIPGIHESTSRRGLKIKSLLLLLGVALVAATTTLAHQIIDH